MNIPYSAKTLMAATVAAIVAMMGRPCVAEDDQPNVLWITAEDMSPILGCYGDRQAITPNIDQLSRESVRFTHAFASAPVCSPARSCLITGCYAPSMGTHHMRSAFPLPKGVTGFPSLLRNAGYFTTNNEKTDYNTSDAERLIQQSWDENSGVAHWRMRPDSRTPFFSVFNLMTTHQSRTMVWPTEKFEADILSQLTPDQIHDPATISLPSYYPDTPVTRREWARLYDCVTVMDQQVGQILQQLQDDGLAEDTIVFFFSDHGSGMPRHKRTLFDTGMHVPLLVRFPQKYAHLSSGTPGSTTDRLVSFVDFAPTMLSLLNLEIPGWMQGKAFMGHHPAASREAVFGHRDRVDEAFDTARSVRTERYLYIRNFMPHVSYNQPTAWPDQGEIRKEFYNMAASGEMTDAQRQFAGPTRPVEELYDCSVDPLNLQNLANSHDHSMTLQKMRTLMADHIVLTGDLGFIPESQLSGVIRARSGVLFDSVESLSIRRQIAEDSLRSALVVGTTDEALVLKIMKSGDSVDRYWAAIAARNLPACSERLTGQLMQMLSDSSPAVRIAAADAVADAVAHCGDPTSAITTLKQMLKSEDLNEVLYAMRTLELLSGDTSTAGSAVSKLAKRCSTILPPATTATFVQTPEQDLAMFISFSANAWLTRQPLLHD